MLPDLDGFEVCRRLRARSDVPIIMVTARADSFDVVAGLEAGADDYVTKPFEPKELTARIRAMLRRAQGFGYDPGVVTLGDRVEVVPDEGVVRVDGEEVHLTRTEFRLLCELAAAPGRVFTREILLESVWGYEYVGDTKLVDVHVYRLRSKIEADPPNRSTCSPCAGSATRSSPEPIDLPDCYRSVIGARPERFRAWRQ